VAASRVWEAAERKRLRGPPVRLGPAAREVVEQVIAEVCAHTGWLLQAVRAQTNHVHVVVAAQRRPEDVLRSFKAWSTRRLREGGHFAQGATVWSRHGSTVYLWNDEARERAIWYVEQQQDG
jgi:REP element-mobilizing transposase RayT